jgi:polyhydroxybutyrate depolymerase
MRRIGIGVLVLASCVSCLATTRADDLTQPGVHEWSLVHDGRTRKALVYVPPQVSQGRKLPLVLAFHGGGGSAQGFREYAGLEPVAAREGFFVVYPEGVSKRGLVSGRFHTWNAGRCCGYAQREGVDDVGFVAALLDELGRALPVDLNRVYATGHSNGAMMTYRLAVELGDRIAAIVAVGGAMNLDSFAPKRPMPVLHIHSVDDPRALYEGGLGPPFPMTSSRVDHRAVETELKLWRDLDGCQGAGKEIERRIAPQGRADAGQEAVLIDYGPCSSGAPVRLWRLKGPGHGWPGREALAETSLRRARIIGPPSAVIETAEEAWLFFEDFTLPAD